jgi:hypothetical protein
MFELSGVVGRTMPLRVSTYGLIELEAKEIPQENFKFAVDLVIKAIQVYCLAGTHLEIISGSRLSVYP